MSFILLLTECREPFEPDFITGQNDFIVVEGFINVGTKAVTTITLSRVSSISEKNQVPENEAALSIEDEMGTEYPLLRTGEGIFQSDSLNLDPSTEYRLMIVDENDNHYASSFTLPKNPPPIDSVHWKWKSDGIQMYVSSHDPGNTTTYYKWDYQETWEIESSHPSFYYFTGAGMMPRGGFWYMLFKCWASAGPRDLKFASTNEFDSDAIDYPLVMFAHYDDRTSIRYSILVEQRAVAKEEFQFLELIKKNAGVTGSLFDPMPSEVSGNIHALSNSGKRIIGYVGASTNTSKRIFVTREEFGVDAPLQCETIEVAPENYSAFFSGGEYVPIDYAPNGNMLAAESYCMDCGLRGDPGKPDFW